MFGRKNKYREVVAGARQTAKCHKEKTFVFRIGKRYYGHCLESDYSGRLLLATEPVIRLLICLPDGTVAQ